MNEDLNTAFEDLKKALDEKSRNTMDVWEFAAMWIAALLVVGVAFLLVV